MWRFLPCLALLVLACQSAEPMEEPVAQAQCAVDGQCGECTDCVPASGCEQVACLPGGICARWTQSACQCGPRCDRDTDRLVRQQTWQQGDRGLPGLRGPSDVSSDPSTSTVYVVGAIDQALVLFDTSNDTLAYISHRAIPGALAVATTGDRRVVVASAAGSRAWPLDESGYLVDSEEMSLPASTNVACGPSDCALLTDNGVVLVDRLGNTVDSASGSFRNASFSPDGTDLYLTGTDGRLYWWALTAEAPSVVSGTPLNDSDALAVSPDGQHLVVTGFCDHEIALFSRAADGSPTPLSLAFDNRPNTADCFAEQLPDEDAPRVLRPTAVAMAADGWVAVSGGSVTAPEIAWLRIGGDTLAVTGFVDDELEPIRLGTLDFVTTREKQTVPDDPTLLGRASALATVEDGVIATVWTADAVVRLDPTTTTELGPSVRAGKHGVDGISGAHELQLTADGRHLYVAPRSQNAVGAFSIEPTTGELMPLPSLQMPLVGDFFGAIGTVALVGQDRQVLAGDVSNPILHVLDRNPDTGWLSHRQAYPIDFCEGHPVLMVAVRGSADGRSVYASDFQRTATSCLLQWARDPETGDLTPLPPRTDAFLSGIEGLELTKDDAHLYTANYIAKSVGHYRRDPDGTLRPEAPFEHPDLFGAEFLELAPDERTVWVSVPAHPETSRVVVLRRDADSGALSYLQTLLPPQDGRLDGVGGLAVSPDGRHLVIAAHHDDALNLYQVAGDGRLTLAESAPTDPSLQWIHDVQFSPDGSTVYAGALQASTVTRWALHTGTDDGCGSPCP